ncbi:hypothetical protein [uncultured Sphingomonas sp.]|uniref:hypothetical protein n=1 Tax=uncultured Sphingomonas sp. TaxID=158754 RepID=UPI0030F63385
MGARDAGRSAGVLAMVGVYYLATMLILPDQPADWPDLDEWYDKQNRLVIGLLIALLLVTRRLANGVGWRWSAGCWWSRGKAWV